MYKLSDYTYNAINLIIKPTDSCNMNCIYCFHNPHSENYQKMTISTVKKIFDITSIDYSQINILWHGGEPLIMGQNFYEDVIDLQKSYGNVMFRNTVQTNLTLLTADIARMFVENNFRIGSSLDGINNDLTRGNTNKILTGYDILKKSGGNCGFIMVISQKNLDSLIDSYYYFKKIGAGFTINLYLSDLNTKSDEFALDEESASKKIIELYNLWLYDSQCNISIGFFHHICKFIINNKKTLCSCNSCLGRWLGIDSNGNIGPCNRYYPSEYMYGNIYDYSSINQAFLSEGFKNILSKSIIRREKCKQCSIYSYCEGGCSNVAMNENGITNNNGTHCKILKNIYAYVSDTLNEIKDKHHYDNLNPFLSNLLKNDN